MSIPEITHLQALVLGCLVGNDERTSIQLQDSMKAYGAEFSGPAFYQLMGRMIDDDLVSLRARVIPGYHREQNIYSITNKGHKLVIATLEHYLSLRNEVQLACMTYIKRKKK